MLRSILVFTLALCVAATAEAEVASYEGSVELLPAAGELRADLTITVKAGDRPLEGASFYLNRAMRVQAFECEACRGYSFDASRSKLYRYAPEGAPLAVTFARPLEPGRTATFRVRYAGGVGEPPWGVNSLTEDWVELALYTAWFPFDPDSKQFRYRLDVTADPAYGLVANADVTGGRGRWRLSEPLPTSDIVVVAARDLKVRTLERSGMRVVVGTRGIDDSVTDRFVELAGRMSDTYTTWLGQPELHRVTFALHRRERGGAYGRPRFLSMPLAADRLDASDEPWIAHEIGHFWWSGAPTTTWEDWLNESFAEYGAWMWVREKSGPDALAARIEKARKRSQGTPPVWEIDRDSEVAYTVLYDKGPLCLQDLESTAGRPAFLALLRSLQRERVESTKALLGRVETELSPAARARLEAALRN